MASSLFGETEIDVEINSSAQKFFNAFANNTHNLSKHTHYIQSCEIVEGECGKLGSVLHWIYFHDGESRVGNDKVVAVDSEKNMIKYQQFEGYLLNYLKTLSITMQVTPKESGVGSVVKWRMEYESNEEKPITLQTLLPFLVQMSKEIDVSLVNEE